MTTPDYTSTQQDAFGELVKQGVYHRDFAHPVASQEFFTQVLGEILAAKAPGSTVTVLDCGCGPGAWLELALALAAKTDDVSVSVYGFDITGEMVDVCRSRFAGRVSPTQFREGDILADSSYGFPDGTDKFDLIFAYDVVQQLPRNLQYKACTTMVSNLAPSGSVVVFDHDSQTPFGRKMGFKKFVTQYLRLPMVPRYYCNAKYPPLRRFAARLRRPGHCEAELKRASAGNKCALIVRTH